MPALSWFGFYWVILLYSAEHYYFKFSNVLMVKIVKMCYGLTVASETAIYKFPACVLIVIITMTIYRAHSMTAHSCSYVPEFGAWFPPGTPVCILKLSIGY